MTRRWHLGMSTDGWTVHLGAGGSFYLVTPELTRVATPRSEPRFGSIEEAQRYVDENYPEQSSRVTNS